MFNYEEAGLYVKDLFKTIFEQGDLDQLSRFYTKDVVGHFNDGDLTYTDIEKRIRLLNEFCLDKRRFEVEQYFVFDNFIMGKSRQTWLSPRDNRLCESYVFFNYRMREGKIAEVWLIVHGSEAGSDYQTVNAKMDEYLNQFELTAYGKNAFFKYMKDYEYFYQSEKVILTSKEQESLFYYMRGYTAKEIAREMDVSHRTIESYLASIMEKYGCNSKAQLRMALFPED